MLFLVLAVASLLSFGTIVVLLLVADTLETRNIGNQRPVRHSDSFTLLNVSQAFEPIYAMLWEAPIHALQLIERAGPGGLLSSRLRTLFSSTARRFPEIYDGYGFEQWLQFLERSELIDWNGQKLRLTRRGREFLEFRCTMQIQMQP